MALVKVNAIVEYVAFKLKPVLEEAVTKTAPGIQFDKDALWKEFLRIRKQKVFRMGEGAGYIYQKVE